MIEDNRVCEAPYIRQLLDQVKLLTRQRNEARKAFQIAYQLFDSYQDSDNVPEWHYMNTVMREWRHDQSIREWISEEINE